MMLRYPRRTFLGLSAATLALAGCGRVPNVDVKGVPGVYRHGNVADPGTFDPNKAQNESDDYLIGDLMMGLTTEDAEGKPIPGVAESWETSEDGLTWTFHLRDHVWSDGMPVTAEDFVYSWRRALAPETASVYAYYLYAVKNAESVNTGKMPGEALGVSAPDSKTFIVQLEKPVPYMTEWAAWLTTYPIPRHVVEAKGDAWTKVENFVGNGAFLFKEWVPNDHITFVKNPLFYDAANVKLDRIIRYPTQNYLAALTWFRAGLIDVQDRLPGAALEWMRKNMPETLHLGQSILSVEYLAFNFTRKIFQDGRVREALDLALDRDSIVTKVLKNNVPAYTIVPPGVANFPHTNEPDFKKMAYADRVKRAQELMRAAGYGPDKRMRAELSIRSAAPDALRVPIAIQEQYKAIYVDIVLVQNDFAVTLDNWNRQNFDIAQAGWGADFNDPVTFLDLMHKGNGNNWWKYENPTFDKLLDSAALERDLVKRGDILAQAEKTALSDHPWAPIFFTSCPVYTRPYVKGWLPNAHDKHRSRWISIA